MDFIRKTFGLTSSQDIPSVTKDDMRPVENAQEQENEKGESLIASILSSLSLGMDIFKTGIPIPVQFHEPMTILQRSAEMMAYSELLLKACEEIDPHSRMAYVAAYTISGFVGSERTYTDFNPLLGETFEWFDETTGSRVLVEQVSNNPPISAFYAESEDFVIHQNVQVQTKFLGNSVDLEPQGRTYIFFKKTGDIFYYKSPKVRIHNLIIGSIWIEHYGDLEIRNLRNGDSCIMEFKKCGLFENTRYDISGDVTDFKGVKIISIRGDWNKNAFGKWLIDTPSHKRGFEDEMWSVKEGFFIGDKYNFTEYAKKLLECDSRHTENTIATSDSRLRLDRRALAQMNYKKASEYKRILEEKQRNDDRERLKNNIEWHPVYFKKMKHDGIEDDMYIYCGNYWECRDERDSSMNGSDVLNEKIRGMACDFRTTMMELGIIDHL